MPSLIIFKVYGNSASIGFVKSKVTGENPGLGVSQNRLRHCLVGSGTEPTQRPMPHGRNTVFCITYCYSGCSILQDLSL